LPPLFAFYYAHDLPIYATSSIYDGYPNRIADKDLNDVIFCDIPWNIETHPEEAQTNSPTFALWPNSHVSNLRLYALGVDAYQVIPLLPRLEALPNFSLNGATGQISLDKNRHLNRGLRCTEFTSGEVKRLGSRG
jgi:outer membrane PBP1 activator LpoA protein